MKPKFDVRKSMDCLLDILSKKFIPDDYTGITVQVLTKNERMAVINAGLPKNVKSVDGDKNMDDFKTKILKKIKTCELVDVLITREGVEVLETQGPEGKITIEAEDDKESKPAYLVEGPQILIRVID